MSSYSFDVLAKLAFEKEIEHIKSNGYSNDKTDHYTILKYLQERIKEIDEEYGEPKARDF